MEDRMITAGAGIEPLQTRLTEQLDHRKLQAESTETRRDLLLHIPDRKPDQLGPYFFFQVLNHRSPDGNSFSYMIISNANDNVSRTVHEYKWFPTGFDSFVGEFKRAYPAQKEVEFKYRFCASGHSKWNWTEYHVKSPLPITYHILPNLLCNYRTLVPNHLSRQRPLPLLPSEQTATWHAAARQDARFDK